MLMRTPAQTLARTLARGAPTLLALGAAACVSIFPKQKPAQLYRFGDEAPARSSAAPAAAGPRFAVLPLPLGFDRAAAGDAILTMTGNEAAYISGSRWVISAQSLFDAAVTRAFDRDGGSARLMSRGETSRPDYTLKLDVRAFEARYEHGPAAAPTVVVEVHAVLAPVAGSEPPRERLFTARLDAGENRVGPITETFARAVAQTLGEVVAWVDARGAG